MTYRIVHYNPEAVECRHWRDLRDRKLPMPMGWAFLCDAETEIPHPETTLYLGKVAKKSARKRGRRDAGNASYTYASELKPFVEYLQWRGIPWTEADPEILFGYIDAQCSRRHWFTGEELAPETLARRVRRVMQAYAYTNRQKLTDLEIDADDLLAELWEAMDSEPGGNGARGGAARPMRHIGDDEWSRITTVLGVLPTEIPDPDNKQQRSRRPSGRNRLVGDLGITTGMRGGELAGLPLAPFLALTRTELDLDAWTCALITDTKGAHPRNVFIPNRLVREILHYAAGDRARAIALAVEEGRSDPGTVFVNGPETGANAGRRMRAQQLSTMFREAVRTALPTEPVAITDENGERLYSRPRFRLHDLRHSFAMRLYHKLVALKKEPWDILQGRLGHRSVEVTRGIYLDMSRTSEPFAADLLAAGLDGLIYG